MKIIFGQARSDIEDHAQRILRAMAAWELRHPSADNIVPRGIAVHGARYPSVCDDCGVTFWANDPYSAHKGCRSGRAVAGFSQQ